MIPYFCMFMALFYSVLLYEELMAYQGKESILKGITLPELHNFYHIKTVLIASITLDIISIFLFIFEGMRIMMQADKGWTIIFAFLYMFANALKDYIFLREDRWKNQKKIKEYRRFYVGFFLCIVYLWIN